MLTAKLLWFRKLGLSRGVIIAAAIAIITSLFLTRNIDFKVYWFGAYAPFAPGNYAYGQYSGAGFPMTYRYPPVTYFFFKPLTFLPLYWAGVLWVLGAWAAAILIVRKAIDQLRLKFTPLWIVAACACALPYVFLAVRAGNIQPYIIAAIFGALLWSETRPALAAGLLAFAVTFKIWPIFFLPWFLRPNRRLVLVWVAPILAALWLAPLLVFSSNFYADLIRQWIEQEFANANADSETWYYPGQSLRGVMLRYFTSLPPWIEGFPSVNFASLSPRIVVVTWQIIALAAYGGCIAMLRASLSKARVMEEKRWLWGALSFALFTVLQPFGLKAGMISLGPAILLCAASQTSATGVAKLDWSRAAFLGASILAFLGAVIQHRPLQRILLAIGIDFYVALLLLAALAFRLRSPASRSL